MNCLLTTWLTSLTTTWWKYHTWFVEKNGCLQLRCTYCCTVLSVGKIQCLNSLTCHCCWNRTETVNWASATVTVWDSLYSHWNGTTRKQEKFLLDTVNQAICRKRLSTSWLCWDGIQVTTRKLCQWMNSSNCSICIVAAKLVRNSTMKKGNGSTMNISWWRVTKKSHSCLCRFWRNMALKLRWIR